MTKWICDRAGIICLTPCYAECEGEDCAPDKCLFSPTRTSRWERVPDEQEQKPEAELPKLTAEVFERPAKLPEWVEIGGYVYSPRNGYGKIIRGSVKSCYIEFDGGAGDFTAESVAQLFLQARLRPYNAEEMRGLVGKMVSTKRDCGIITGYRGEDNKVIVALEDIRYSAENLLKINATIDGKPCGVLEHLNDAGEWVE